VTFDGDGYVEYECRNPTTGLANQCWKGQLGFDAVRRPAARPRADRDLRDPGLRLRNAQRRSARLAREVWDDKALAQRLDRRAGDLRQRFRRDFWMPDRGCHALALDGDKQAGRQA